MGRPKKETAEWFPHVTKSGRTIYILESKYGNDGYAFWFKVLELLCDTEGQTYDCKNPANWEFLTAKTRVTTEKAEEILNTLAALGSIDQQLWEEDRKIWCQKLVDNLFPLFKKRQMEIPHRPVYVHREKKANGFS